MKRTIILAVLSIAPFLGNAQNRIGLEMGAGVPMMTQNASSVNMNVAVNASAYYLRKVARHVYVGARLYYEQYGIDYSNTTTDLAGGVLGTQVSHKSNYIFAGPMIDAGVGRYREYLHFYMSAAMGVLVGGSQSERNYYATDQNPQLAYDYTKDTHLSINNPIFRIGMGIKQHFPVSRMWQITLNEGYSFMPFGDLSSPDGVNDKSLHPGYVSFQVGVMRKFKDFQITQPE